MFKKIQAKIYTLFTFISHLLAIAVIFISWFPIAKWYYNYQPILGVDFFNSVTYASYLARNFMFRANGWKYFWYGGTALDSDYPTLHLLPAAFLTKIFTFLSQVQAVQIYMLFLTFLFLVGVYFLLYVIGRSKVVSTILTVAVAWSFAIYGALVWGGSLPYYGTQLFFPFTLLFLVLGLQTKQKRFLYISALIAGMSIPGHPQIFFTYILIATSSLLLFWVDYPFSIKKSIKRLFEYFLVAGIVVFTNIYNLIGSEPWLVLLTLLNKVISTIVGFIVAVFTRFGGSTQGLNISTADGGSYALKVAEYNRNQLRLFFERTNDLLFWALGISIVLFILAIIIRRNKRNALKVLPYIAVTVAITLYISLLAFGIDFLHGAWYRVFWTFPVALSMVISFIWSDFAQSLGERFDKLFQKRIIKAITVVVVSAMLIFISTFALIKFQEKFWNSTKKYHGEIEWSSAYPRVVNGIKTKEELAKLLPMLHPSWMDPNNRQYRFYDADAQTSIWWNAYFNMPLVRGYIDPPVGADRMGGFFWVSTSLNDNEATKIFKIPENIAKNNSLFLIDWYSIKYLSALHMSDNHIPLSTYIDTDEVIKQKESLGPFSHKIELYNLKTSNTDPRSFILATNKPVIWADTLLVGKIESMIDLDQSLNSSIFLNENSTLLDSFINDPNLNRFSIIMLKGGSYTEINDSSKNLTNYIKDNPDASFASLSYLNGGKRIPLGNLENYLGNGGKVIIDISDGKDFRDLKYNLTEDSSVIVTSNGQPLVTRKKHGKGELVLSRLNLVKGKNTGNEAFTVLLKSLLGETKKDGTFKAYSDFGKQIIIEGENAQTVALSSRLGADKWVAKVVDGGKLTVYTVGTTSQGFSPLVFLPEDQQKHFTVEFEFTGEQPFNFYEVKDELVSPILHPVNVPVIGVITSDAGYETFLKILGGTNLNSQKVVPIKLPQLIDEIDSAVLEHVDALVLYGYDYKNYQKSWNKIKSFIESGKSVFLETGMDVKQSNSENAPKGIPTILPEVFPIEKTSYKVLGREWSLEKSDDSLFDKVDIQKFGPPLLNNNEWRFSYTNQVREGSKVLLTQEGKPVLASKQFGKGNVIWSGMNLPYHYINVYSMEEAILMENIIKKLVILGDDKRTDVPNANFDSPRKVSLKGQNARGVLFKEQNYRGWTAKLSINGGGQKNVPIFKTGPTFPGFMYVPLPKEARSQTFEVEFQYNGSYWNWFYRALTLIIILSILDYSFLGNRILNKYILYLTDKLKKKMGKWWEKEDEY